MTTMTKQLVTTVAALAGGAGADASMVISTGSPDREGDRVIPSGVDLSNFRRNAPLLWGHDTRSLPIGVITAIEVTAQGLKASWRWLTGDAFAARVKNAWDQGVVRAASIGFAPREYVPNGLGGLDHLKWELLEVSLVPVPANAEAVRALKALGLSDPDVVADHARDGVVRGHVTAAAAWLQPSPWRPAFVRSGPMHNPHTPGKPTCGGPDAAGCQWRHPMPIEDCPANQAHGGPGCPIAGQNVVAGIVITDPHRLDAVLRGAERVTFRDEDFAEAFSRAIEEALREPMRRAAMMATGKID